MDIVAIALTVSNLSALAIAVTAVRRARYWRSVVEGPHGDRLDVPDSLEGYASPR